MGVVPMNDYHVSATPEGRECTGLAAVREWIEETTTTKYRPEATVTTRVEATGGPMVTARL